MKICVLGTKYEIKRCNYDKYKDFKKLGTVGCCNGVMKEIVVCNMATYPGCESESNEYCKRIESETLRHEIVHAYLNESGLQDSAGQPVGAWSKNEEMVDWIALQFPKMVRTFQEVGCL